LGLIAISATARSVGRGAVIVGMLSTKAPATGLPEGALFNTVIRTVLITPKTVWELELSSLMSLAKHNMAV